MFEENVARISDFRIAESLNTNVFAYICTHIYLYTYIYMCIYVQWAPIMPQHMKFVAFEINNH